MSTFLRSLLYSLLVASALAQNGSSEDSSNTGDASSSQSSGHVDDAGGASGSSNGYNLSKGGIIAIIVVCGLVAMFGIASAVLFYVAKKRQWEVRKTIKRASKRVVSKVDPRQSRRQSRPKGAVRMQSPRSKDLDLEKGNAAKTNIKANGRDKRQPMQVDDTQVAATIGRKAESARSGPWAR